MQELSKKLGKSEDIQLKCYFHILSDNVDDVNELITKLDDKEREVFMSYSIVTLLENTQQ